MISHIYYFKIQKNLSIELLKNSSLSNNKVKDSKIVKFINQIVGKFNLIAIIIKNIEFNS